LELDDDFKKLIKELGTAINESLAESEKISDVMGRIRSAGYDLFLVLEVTIGFNKRGATNVVHRQKLSADEHSVVEFHLTSEDAQFLRELKISVDEGLH
jgi:predicted fused transcriptional regulator/phosphomethylpyrimidine kinase